MYIYLITNSKNDKCYVGKTSRTSERRWKDHVSKAKAGSKTHLHQAIRKYGAENFQIQVLCKVRHPEHTNTMERHFIALLNTMGEFGYNLTPGGDGVAPGTKLTEEHRAKLSAAHKGKPNIGHFKKGQIPHTKGKSLSADTRKKISVGVSRSLVGNTHRAGKPHSEEIKKRIAASMKASPNGSPKLMSERAKKFWAEISPEDRAEYISRREATRQATLLNKRLALGVSL